MMTVPCVNAAMSRFRVKNRWRSGVTPGGYSVITAPPCVTTRSNNPSLRRGYTTPAPQAATTIDGAPPPSAVS